MTAHGIAWPALRVLSAAALLLAGAGDIRGQVVPVDSARLMRVVAALAHDSMEGRKLGSAGGARARELLAAELRGRGIEPLVADYVQSFTVSARGGGELTGGNVLGVIRGTRYPARYLVVSAHYDHLGVHDGHIFNGADDNASGTAVALEVASRFRAEPPDHSIIIALLDGEEAGLSGAQALLDDAAVPVDAIILNINLDMVGRSARGELWVAGTHHYPQLADVVRSVASRAELTLRAGHDTGSGPQNWTGASDHAAFHARGIPFLYFGVEDHEDYHRPSDDVAAIDPSFLVRAARAIIDAVRTVDARPDAGTR